MSSELPPFLLHFLLSGRLPMFLTRLIARPALFALAAVLLSVSTYAQDSLRIYSPGGSAPALREAATAFEKKAGAKIEIIAGPEAQWLGEAKNDADLIFSGSEAMMTDVVNAMDGQLSHFKVTSLYLRPLSILVRPGNPKRIHGVKDILKPGVKVLVVNGIGQRGSWEDMAGRKGDLNTVIALRKNIVSYVKNSFEAKQSWMDNKDIDVWLTWNIWQVANPQLSDVVPIERDYVIYRDCNIAITQRAEGKPSAKGFVEFLQSADGARIFAKWGWITGRQ
jgi:accessory colonization factor AcfC